MPVTLPAAEVHSVPTSDGTAVPKGPASSWRHTSLSLRASPLIENPVLGSNRKVRIPTVSSYTALPSAQLSVVVRR